MYYGIENQTHCSYSSLYLSIFLSFNAKFVSQFSQELCELEASNTVQNERLYRGIETQGHGSYSFIFYPFFFFLFLYCMLAFKICVSFLRSYCS